MFACNVTCTTSNWLLLMEHSTCVELCPFSMPGACNFSRKQIHIGLGFSQIQYVYVKHSISVNVGGRSTNSKYRYWFSQNERMKKNVKNKWNWLTSNKSFSDLVQPWSTSTDSDRIRRVAWILCISQFVPVKFRLRYFSNTRLLSLI